MPKRKYGLSTHEFLKNDRITLTPNNKYHSPKRKRNIHTPINANKEMPNHIYTGRINIDCKKRPRFDQIEFTTVKKSKTKEGRDSNSKGNFKESFSKGNFKDSNSKGNFKESFSKHRGIPRDSNSFENNDPNTPYYPRVQTVYKREKMVLTGNVRKRCRQDDNTHKYKDDNTHKYKDDNTHKYKDDNTHKYNESNRCNTRRKTRQNTEDNNANLNHRATRHGHDNNNRHTENTTHREKTSKSNDTSHQTPPPTRKPSISSKQEYELLRIENIINQNKHTRYMSMNTAKSILNIDNITEAKKASQKIYRLIHPDKMRSTLDRKNLIGQVELSQNVLGRSNVVFDAVREALNVLGK